MIGAKKRCSEFLFTDCYS